MVISGISARRILDLHAEYGLRATSFVPGFTIDRHPGLVERIVGAVHEVGHHSDSHRSAVDLSEAKKRARCPLRACLAAPERAGVRLPER